MKLLIFILIILLIYASRQLDNHFDKQDKND